MTKTKEKILFWIGGIFLFCGFLYSVSSILLPFVVGIMVAYFLDPVVDKIEDLGSSRSFATASITTIFFLIIIISALLLLPVMYDQFLALAGKIPEYVTIFHERYAPEIEKILKQVDGASANELKDKISGLSGYIIDFTGKVIANAWASGVALLNLVSLIFISPIVAFFMLRDWDKMVAKIDSWLPRKSAKTIREQMSLIDGAVSGYVRGMGNVAILLGIFYATGLSLIGLDFGLFIGLATGFLCFIPYVGVFIGMTTGLAVAYFQFGDIEHVGMVLAVFMIGQFIEGNFVTPRIVGKKVGLHPIWIIFGLLAGGALFGFVGVLIAVPVTAVIGVLSRFALSEYMKSSLYSGKKR